MRTAAYLALALVLTLGAVGVLTGTPPALAQGGGQSVDDVQVEMVSGGQPETLFPTGTKTAAGQVRYNIRTVDGTPVQRQTTVVVVDAVGLEVYSTTFQTSTAYEGYATHQFSVSGDEMFDVYVAIASARLGSALTSVQPITPAVTEIDTPKLLRLGEVATNAQEARRAMGQLLEFTEVPTPTAALLAAAVQDLVTATTLATALQQAGPCVPPPTTGTPPNVCTAQRLQDFNNALTTIKQRIQDAADDWSAALPDLSGLSDLSIPSITGCDRDATGRAVPRTYTTNVIQSSASGEPATRDSWEWQVGTPTGIPVHALLEPTPNFVYSMGVTVSSVHTATIRAQVLDDACLPVPDGMTVTFRTTIGAVTPVTLTTSSQAGAHGLAATVFTADEQFGTAVVRLLNVTLAAVGQTDVVVVGPAAQLAFLTPQGQSEDAVRYVQQGTTAELQVQVRDGAGTGRPVADGTPVQFSVTNSVGTFEACAGGTFPATTRNGLASVCFRAGGTPGPAVVTATVEGTEARDTQDVRVVGLPAATTLTVQTPYSTTLYLGGLEPPRAAFTFIEATVTDAAGQPVADNTQVELRLLTAGRVQWESPVAGAPLITRVRTTGGKARAKVIGQTLGTVDIRAFVSSPPLISAPLRLTVMELPPPPPVVYRLFLPHLQ